MKRITIINRLIMSVNLIFVFFVWNKYKIRNLSAGGLPFVMLFKNNNENIISTCAGPFIKVFSYKFSLFSPNTVLYTLREENLPLEEKLKASSTVNQALQFNSVTNYENTKNHLVIYACDSINEQILTLIRSTIKLKDSSFLFKSPINTYILNNKVYVEGIVVNSFIHKFSTKEYNHKLNILQNKQEYILNNENKNVLNDVVFPFDMHKFNSLINNKEISISFVIKLFKALSQNDTLKLPDTLIYALLYPFTTHSCSQYELNLSIQIANELLKLFKKRKLIFKDITLNEYDTLHFKLKSLIDCYINIQESILQEKPYSLMYFNSCASVNPIYKLAFIYLTELKNPLNNHLSTTEILFKLKQKENLNANKSCKLKPHEFSNSLFITWPNSSLKVPGYESKFPY